MCQKSSAIGSLFFFGSAMAAYTWLTASYGGATLITIPLAGLAVFFTIGTIASVKALLNPSFLRGSSVDVLNLKAQSFIRYLAVILPIPALAYCGFFAWTVTQYNISHGDTRAQIYKLFETEMSTFGKSVAYNYVDGFNSAPTTNAEPDYGGYMANLQRKIKSHWFPPKGYETRITCVQFKAGKNGSLTDLHLIRSSGNAEADKKAVQAVCEAAPFSALPDGSPDSVDIQFTLDYNVYGRK